MRWSRLLPLAVVVWTGCGDDAGRSHEPAERGSTTAPPPAASSEVQPRLIEVTAEEVPALLRAQPGRVLMVNVWSTWCEPCVEEFPELLRIARTYEDRGLGVLFLSADPRVQHEAALTFLREQGAPMPGYVKVGSDDAFIGALHPEWSGTLPATMLFDAQRRPQALWEEPVDRATLTPPIERMLATP